MSLVSSITIFAYSAFPSIETSIKSEPGRIAEGNYGLIVVFGFGLIHLAVAFAARGFYAKYTAKSANDRLNKEIAGESDRKNISQEHTARNVATASRADWAISNVIIIVGSLARKIIRQIIYSP